MEETSKKSKKITETERSNIFNRNATFAFISGIVSLVLSSWVFQFIIWGILDVVKVWKIL